MKKKRRSLKGASIFQIMLSVTLGFAFPILSATAAPTNTKKSLRQKPLEVQVTSAVSRKTHGSVGDFDIDLPLTGGLGIECRRGGTTDDYTIVVAFPNTVTVDGNPQAQLTAGIGDVGSGGGSNGGTVTIQGNVVTVPLTNIANAQMINVRLNGVNGSSTVDIPMGVLIGDVAGSGVVNSSSVALTKSRVGQQLDVTNFRSDVNTNGTINASDRVLTSLRSGTGLPGFTIEPSPNSQSLSFSGPTTVTTTTFTVSVDATFSGYDSYGLSYWLEVPSALAPFISIANVTYSTFPDPMQTMPNPAAFNSAIDATSDFLTETRDLGATVDPMIQVVPGGKYHIADLTFTIDPEAPPGTYTMRSTTRGWHVSEFTDTNFNGNAIIPAGTFTFTVKLPPPPSPTPTPTSTPTPTPTPTPPQETTAVSRKTHGNVGDFDISLPLTGSVGIESRTGGATSDYTIVVAFLSAVSVEGKPQAEVTLGSGDVGSGGVPNGGVVSINGQFVTVPITNVANAQMINVRLNGVNGSSNLDIPMSILIGDVRGIGVVDSSSVALIRSRVGQTVDATNFRSDTNANGSINSSDSRLTGLRSGTGLPGFMITPGTNTQSLSFSGPTTITTTPFTISVDVTYTGYGSYGLSYWLEAPSDLAPFIKITDVAYSTFPNPMQTAPNPAPFKSFDAKADFLTDTRDLGAMVYDPVSEIIPAGTYHITDITFSLSLATPPGTYTIQSSTHGWHVSELTDTDFNSNAISPAGTFTFTIPSSIQPLPTPTPIPTPTPPAPPKDTTAVSRKTHGSAGDFDINLPLTGGLGIECRRSGATNDYTIVVAFPSAVTVDGNPQAQLTAGIGDVGSGGVSNGGTVTVEGNVVTVPLTNIANAQIINVRLNSVNGSSNVDIPMGVLIGDVAGSGVVNSSSVALIKSRVGQQLDETNFRSDMNANGAINASDRVITSSRSGTGLSGFTIEPGPNSQSLTFIGPTTITATSFTVSVDADFSGYDSYGLSYWLEVPSALAPFISITSAAYSTFPDPMQTLPNPAAFNSAIDATSDFLTETRDLGGTVNDPSLQGIPPGTYHITDLTFTLDPEAPPGTYTMRSTTRGWHVSELTDTNFNANAIIPAETFTFTIPPHTNATNSHAK